MSKKLLKILALALSAVLLVGVSDDPAVYGHAMTIVDGNFTATLDKNFCMVHNKNVTHYNRSKPYEQNFIIIYVYRYSIDAFRSISLQSNK